MDFRPINDDHRNQMLEAVGVSNITELFSDIPAQALLTEPVAISNGLTEIELVAHLRELADLNTPATQLVSFAGGGVYDHYTPAFVDYILRRPEFFTAYTPYQPEVSQGTLQAMYEYQTGICNLTGMDVSNASMYDGATAMVEAAYMAIRVIRKRDKVVLDGALHPQYLETMNTYALAENIEIEIIASKDGASDTEALINAATEKVAAIITAYPGYLGAVQEDIVRVGEAIHAAGGLWVVVANPVLLAILEAPGVLGADIVVGEAQSFGNAMSFGGPGLGFFACRSGHMRQMPGRLVGQTVDVDGNTGYVLTISTREQHIRREKATSNICSNHALNALAAGAYLAGVGPRGLTQVAETSIAHAHYLQKSLLETGLFERINELPFGYEFALRYSGDASELHATLLDAGYLAGIVLENNVMLFATTERRTKDEIDSFVNEVAHHG